jgi:hypothetical protein
LNLQPYDDLVTTHRRWLEPWPSQLRDWDARFANNPQSAIAEAWIRQQLSNHVQIDPHEIPGAGGIDFMCSLPEGPVFGVEVANLDANAIGSHTHLPEKLSDWRGGSPGSISKRLRDLRRRKSTQISRLQKPVLLAITCLHETVTFVHFRQSDARELLIPPTERVIPFSRDCDAAFGSETWEEPLFNDSFFFKPGKEKRTITGSCDEISGVLLCAVPWMSAERRQPEIHLVLNPVAAHPFNRAWLPSIRCYQLCDDWQGIDPCEWTVLES